MNDHEMTQYLLLLMCLILSSKSHIKFYVDLTADVIRMEQFWFDACHKQRNVSNVLYKEILKVIAWNFTSKVVGGNLSQFSQMFLGGREKILERKKLWNEQFPNDKIAQ